MNHRLNLLAAAAALTWMTPLRAEILTFQATLDGHQEVPPVTTPATGAGMFTLDTVTREFTWNITFQGLSSAQTAAHFHGAAPQCAPAGVTLPLPTGSPIVGSQIVSAQHAADIQAGLWYVNIHSANHLGGEIRGQVMPTPLSDPLPNIQTGEIHVRLDTVSTGLIAPNWGISSNEFSDFLFVTDQDGTLWSIDLTSNDPVANKTALLDVSSLLVPLGVFGPNSFDERGLLGVALTQAPLAVPRLYTYTSEPATSAPDFSTIPMGESADHQSVVREWLLASPITPIDPGSSRELLRIDQPQFNHNAGAVNIGPDDMLYIALGDGGGADDKDGQSFLGAPLFGHGCGGNALNTANPLGSILRIDPFGSNSANGEYGIPADNPFAPINSPDLDEIFRWGLRNPFRFSFDQTNGDMFIADVGQNDVEEINHVPFPFPALAGEGPSTLAGGNFGWNHKEGSFFFVANGTEPGYITDRPLTGPTDVIDPIAEYDHDDGIAIVGGFVYRGVKIPALQGRYVFGEFAQTFGNDGRLFYLDTNGAIREFNLLGQNELGVSLLGFGQDANGEIYVLANSTGTPFPDAGTGEPTGVVLRIAPKTGDLDANGVVNGADLANLLANFGPAPTPNAADFDMDGDVDGADLAALLANFG